MNDRSYVSVRDAMTSDLVCIDGMASVEEALDLMRRDDISSLVVDRRDERDEYGLVLIADIAREIVGHDRSPTRTNVYEIMTKPPIAIDAEMNVKYAVRLMTRHGQSHCIVVAGRKLAGILTLRDALLGHIGQTNLRAARR